MVMPILVIMNSDTFIYIFVYLYVISWFSKSFRCSVKRRIGPCALMTGKNTWPWTRLRPEMTQLWNQTPNKQRVEPL